MPINSPIDLQLPQTPRLPSEGNAAVYSEFQSVYNALRNLWAALGSASLIEDAPSDGQTYGRKDGMWTVVTGGGGSVTWGSITGDINSQTDLIAKFTTINDSLTAINVDLTNLWTAMSTKIGDAPSDGKEYVRKNGIWVEASGGTGGVYLPVVTGEVPPVLVYLEDGSLVYARIE